MLTARLLVSVLCASAEVDTLETHFLSVVLSPVLRVLVVQMLTAPPLAGQPYASVSKAIQETLTQTAALIPARAIPVVRELSVKIMAGLLSANVLHGILEIPMCHVDWILAREMLVDPTLTAPEVERELCAPAEEATLEAHTAGQAAEPIPVWRVCVGGALNVKM